MSDFVLDASLALQWFLEDEENRKYSQAVLASLSEKRALVPLLWFYEVGNGLLMACPLPAQANLPRSGTRSSRFFTRTGIISPVKLILLNGHAEEKSLAVQCDLAQADVAEEHQKAMRVFPVRGTPLLFSIAASFASPHIVAPCRTQK